jgi:hypothetical protein
MARAPSKAQRPDNADGFSVARKLGDIGRGPQYDTADMTNTSRRSPTDHLAPPPNSGLSRKPWLIVHSFECC